MSQIGERVGEWAEFLSHRCHQVLTRSPGCLCSCHVAVILLSRNSHDLHLPVMIRIFLTIFFFSDGLSSCVPTTVHCIPT